MESGCSDGPNRVRFVHKVLSESGQHVITSPDIKGFCIVAATRDEAERDALDMIALIRSKDFPRSTGRLSAVEFEAA